MPDNHRYQSTISPSLFIKQGKQIGPATGHVVETILQSRKHPEQGFRSCQGLLRLGQKYSVKRLEAACQRSVHFNQPTYKMVMKILEKGLDLLNLSETEKQEQLHHENIRGAQYYQPTQAKENDVYPSNY